MLSSLRRAIIPKAPSNTERDVATKTDSIIEIRKIGSSYTNTSGCQYIRSQCLSLGAAGTCWERWTQCFGLGKKHNVVAPGWKPATLQGPILGSFIFASISIITVLEVLSRMGSRDANGGGLVFAADVKSLPKVASFGYLYFPTILAVIYSMVWSWVDLDVKRLEPWFQLSKKKGARAEDSLLLQHWNVFSAGTIMLIVFWAITPLQSAIFNTGTVTRSIPVAMSPSANLVSIDRQAELLNANFLNTAYAVAWLGQKLPAFTAVNYTVLPFGPISGARSSLSSETWTAAADAFSTSISCTPANVEVTKIGYTFSNGKGCSVSQISLPASHKFGNYMVNYIGYFNNPHVDWALQNSNCTAKFSNNFLALWASGAAHIEGGIYSNITALFCETRYNIQPISVTVNASDNAIVGMKLSEERRSQSTIANVKDVLNTTAFEYVLATGVNSEDQEVNLPDRAVLEQYPRLMNYSLTWPVSNMVGFAVALNPSTVAALADPSALQTAFERAHQLLFTTAFTSLLDMSDTTNRTSSPSHDGLVQDVPGAIILVRPVAIAVEVALGFVAVMTVLLWSYSYQRRSNLEGDPSSIADLMTVLQARQISQAKTNASCPTEKSNQVKPATGEIYRLAKRNIAGHDSRSAAMAMASFDIPDRVQSVGGHEEDSPSRPVELRLWAGVTFIMILSASIIGLAVLDRQIVRHNGLTLPSSNPIVLSIIENYLPTIFATFLEPVWVVLNRNLCLLKPFDELRKGNAKSLASVEARYTSLPPPLVLWRALRSGHFLLAAICLTVISSNLLAVSLSTLLNEGRTIATFPSTAQRPFLPQFNDTRIRKDGIGGPAITYFDHFYIELSNLASNTSLPPWVDDAYYYLPFTPGYATQISSPDSSAILKGFKGSTTGFGANVNCTNLLLDRDVDGYQLLTNSDGLTAAFSTSHQLPNGTHVTCVPLAITDALNETVGFTLNFPEGDLGLDVMQAMFPAGGLDDAGFCSKLLVAGWVRTTSTVVLDPVTGTINSTTIGNVSSSFVACTAKLEVADFDVSVDTTARVDQVNRTSGFLGDASSFFAGNGTELNLFRETLDLLAPVTGNLFRWHNTSVTSDWMNSLLAIQLGSQRLVDPSVRVPIGSEIAPLLETLYRKLFAIILALNADNVFLKSPNQRDDFFEEVVEVSRIFLSPPMLVVSLAILVFHQVMAILYYMYRPKNFLPSMPTSIGAIFSYVCASRAVENFGQERRKRTSDKDGDITYAYGRFVGTDGKTHVGIDLQRFVVPLKSRNPEAKRRKWRWNSRVDETQPKTWI